MKKEAPHVIALRPNSPLAAMLEKYQHCHMGNVNHDCMAIACNELRQGIPGFLDIDVLHPDLQKPLRLQISASEILLISDAPGTGSRPIGFLREG